MQGLLAATLPSKIGDTLRCEVKIDRLDGPPSRLALSWACTNQEGALVMNGGSEGGILQPSDPSTSADGGGKSRDR